MHLEDSIREIPYVVDRQTALFKKIGVSTILDLLNHIPFRYEDTRHIFDVKDAIHYVIKKNKNRTLSKSIIVQGIIKNISSSRLSNSKILVKANLIDNQDPQYQIELVWFNQAYIKETVHNGSLLVVKGKPQISRVKMTITPEDYETKQPYKKLVHLGRLSPIYSGTRGLSTKMIRRYITNTQPVWKNIIDPIPPNLLKQEKLISITQAYWNLHFPESPNNIIEAIERLSVQELLELHSNIATLHRKHISKIDLTIKKHIPIVQKFVKNLPFKFTRDQKTTVDTLYKNVVQKKTVDDLICGDVGSGKTIVVFTTLINYLLDSLSVIIIAPTTVLSNQHYATCSSWISSIKELNNINVQLVSSRTRNLKIPKDSVHLLIGTQALLFRKDLPSNVGLLIFDEQHKFGVGQRKSLIEQISLQAPTKTVPHIITMTATPIPRTMALSAYGYQKTHYIHTMPNKRLPVKSFLIKQEQQDSLYKWIGQKIKKGKSQVYIVFPLIDESESLKIASVTKGYQDLQTVFGKKSIGLLHGRLKETEKNQILKNFTQNKFPILATTTVIEVGIDIPNASIMLIHNPERFGLAQLHQLRGRIGRGEKQSYCYLLPDPEIHFTVKNRLQFFINNTLGIKIAEYDMKHRGPGELYGQVQSGVSHLKVASFFNSNLLNKARRIYKKMKLQKQTLNKRFFQQTTIV